MSTLETHDVRVASLAESLDRIYHALTPVGRDSACTAQSVATSIFAEPCEGLRRIESSFGLSPFERDLLLLCAGASLEGRFLSACSAAHGDTNAIWPTLGLALSVLDRPHWSAISRARPLLYWRLIEVGSAPLLHAPLRIDERILQYLLGVPALDERLEALVRPMEVAHRATNLRSNQSAAIELAVRHWKRTPPTCEPILLVSNHHSVQQSTLIEICRNLGLRPYSLRAADIPSTPAECYQLARLWTREAVLSGGVLYIHTNEVESHHRLKSFLDLLETPVAVEVRPGSAAECLEGLRLHLAAMTASERKQVWTEQLGPTAHQMNGSLDRIVEQFQFDEPAIEISAAAARDEIAAREECDPGRLAWNACRHHARHSLENLAQRLEPRAQWDELVLPEQQIETLRQIAVHARHRAVVHDQWGFAAKYGRGLGLSVLFAGATGTGKTMAAELIAAELDQDLYRIDLASVVSKYIGDTEKNLRSIFDAAEESGAILLFDEADALFGKRSEVRDSHDRYANLEVSYLLQRIETYHGVAILTTNMQHALDPAFTRRIRFIVPFGFPDVTSRARIWQRIFPSTTPVDELDFERLAQLNISGGVIRNIAAHAAFLAADDQATVGMRHLLAAARTEYAKMDKPLTAAETRGWA